MPSYGSKRKKPKSELFELYNRRLDISRRWREQEGLDSLWHRLIDLYRGKHWAPGSEGQDLVAVNLAFSTVNVIAPSVSVNHPKIVVSPNEPENDDRAAFVEAVVNYLWKHYDFRTPFRRAVKDFLILGHGWVKVGWRFIEQEQSLSDTEREEMMQQGLMEADRYAEGVPLMAGDLPTDEDIRNGVPKTESRVVDDRPFVERVSPFDIFVDPEATCMDDATWIAQRVVRPLEEAQRDKRYRQSTRRKLSADAGLNPRYTDDYERNRSGTDIERVTVWEFYDMENNTMSVLSSNGDDFLIDPKPMPYAYGQPFVMVRNYDVPDHFYPMGDLEAIEPLQEELNKTRTQLVQHRKRYARKYLYHERSFGPEGRSALEADDDGRLVPVVDENRPLSEVVVPMPQIPISPEIYNHSAIIEDDINTVSGLSEYARGGMPEIRRTATEASILADAQNARASDKLAIIELGIGAIARRIIQLMQQYMTGDQMARITGKNGDNLYIPFSRDDIVGEYDFDVEAGSTQPMNDTIRKQQAVSLLNAVAPLVGTVIDPSALARHVLQQGFGIKNPEKFLMQQQPPMPGAEGGQPPSPDGGMPMGPPVAEPPGMEQAFAPTGGVPPEILTQLQNQMGMSLPSL